MYNFKFLFILNIIFITNFNYSIYLVKFFYFGFYYNMATIFNLRFILLL